MNFPSDGTSGRSLSIVAHWLCDRVVATRMQSNRHREEEPPAAAEAAGNSSHAKGTGPLAVASDIFQTDGITVRLTDSCTILFAVL